MFCYDVDGLMNALGSKHDPQEWRLFIDSLKLSLKTVLLHNGNQHPSIPVGHAVHMKETYENLKQLLYKLECSKYGWHICGDLKVVSLLMGLQLGYRKYCCFYVNVTAEQRLCITWRLASEEISLGRIDDCATPNTGRMAQNPATAPTHQTRSD